METLFYYIAINYNGIPSLSLRSLGLMNELVCLYVYSFIINFYLEVLKNPPNYKNMVCGNNLI